MIRMRTALALVAARQARRSASKSCGLPASVPGRVSMKSLGGVGGLVLLVGLLGCGMEPIPRIAVPGSTITIPVPSDFGYPGFGRVIQGDPMSAPAFDPTESLEDFQRGELVFEMVGQGQTHFLEKEFVTRVRLDPHSPLSLGEGEEDFPEGQILAFVRIPENVVPGPYEIFVSRYRREAGSGYNFVKKTTYVGLTGEVWQGWGGASGEQTPQDGIPIQIVAQPSGGPWYTPRRGYGRGLFGPFDITGQDLLDLTPYPAMQFEIRDISASPTKPAAAMDLDFTYKVKKFAIRGVTAYSSQSNRILVSWQTGIPSTTAVPCTHTEATDTLEIQILDPDRQAFQYAIAFDLREENIGNCVGRAVQSDFQLQMSSSKGYNENGVAVPISFSYYPIF